MSEMTVSAPSFEAKAKLYGALARLQANLPKVAKASTADTGTYKYQYAGLDAVTDAAMPVLGKFGLAFIALPTLNEAGNFVLSYSLVHEAGAEISGEYPLPDKGSAQQLGSAITYARRYTLTAATGIAPGGEDDDGAAASAYQYSNSRQQQRPQQPQQRGERPQQQAPRPAAESQPARPTAVPDAGTGDDPEAEFVRKFVARTAEADETLCRSMRVELGKAVAAKVIAPETANELGQGIIARLNAVREAA